jgi:hypothetical protein
MERAADLVAVVTDLTPPINLLAALALLGRGMLEETQVPTGTLEVVAAQVVQAEPEGKMEQLTAGLVFKALFQDHLHFMPQGALGFSLGAV